MQLHWLKRQCILVSREFTLFQKKKCIKEKAAQNINYQLHSQNNGITEDPSLPGCSAKQSSTLKTWAVWSFESVVFIIRHGTTSHNTSNLSNTAMWTSYLTTGSMSRQHSGVHTVSQMLMQLNKHSILWITAPPLTLLHHKLKYSHHPISTRRFRSP